MPVNSGSASNRSLYHQKRYLCDDRTVDVTGFLCGSGDRLDLVAYLNVFVGPYIGDDVSRRELHPSDNLV
jgi:hypothetical protein